MPRGRPPGPKKGKFDDLDSDWKDAVAASSVEEINSRIVEVAKNQEDNLKSKDEDQDLAEKQELAKEAGAQYKDATKANRLKTQYLLRVLSDKGAA